MITIRRNVSLGFTLIEVLAAMTLLALLATVLLGTVRNAEQSTTAATNANERSEQYTRTHAFLSEHIANALPLRWRREANQPLKFAGSGSSITYLAPITSFIADGGVMWWQLGLRSNGEKKQLTLTRLPQDPEVKDVPDLKDGEVVVLADRIDGLALAYFDPGEEPVTQPEGGSWVDAWDENTRMPSLVRIRITEVGGYRWPELIVPLKISQSIGCNFDFARQRCVISSSPTPVQGQRPR
jgi:general secretion pathway protein J